MKYPNYKLIQDSQPHKDIDTYCSPNGCPKYLHEAAARFNRITLHLYIAVTVTCWVGRSKSLNPLKNTIMMTIGDDFIDQASLIDSHVILCYPRFIMVRTKTPVPVHLEA